MTSIQNELENITPSQRLMLSLDRLRGSNFLCDFHVKVGDKSFSVHRLILAASSDYFEAMFSSNMKEIHDGFVDMKDVDQVGIAQCIEFMYKGEADLKIENIQHILKASSMLQMVSLTNLCFQYLQNNLSPTNCLDIISLAQNYDRSDLKNQAECVIINNFESVIFTESFASVCRSDLIHYIEASNSSYKTLWNAVVQWAKGKNGDESVTELIKDIGIENFPFSFIFETILKNQLIENYKSVKDFVVTVLFSNVKRLEESLNIDNFFTLKSLSKAHQIAHPDSTKKVLSQFMEENFESVIEREEFLNVSKKSIIGLLSSSKTKCTLEPSKWKAAISWVKQDLRGRKQHFEELFTLIKLDCLPVNFLKNEVKSEKLVKRSEKCTELLMDELLSRLAIAHKEIDQLKNPSETSNRPSNPPRKRQLQPDGDVSHRVVRGVYLEGYPPMTNPIEIVYRFPPGNWEHLSYRTKVFTAYLPDTNQGRQLFHSLMLAFTRGLTFHVQKLREGFGKIVWSDIPHRTSLDSKMPCYYPDKQYLIDLRRVLESKGVQ